MSSQTNKTKITVLHTTTTTFAKKGDTANTRKNDLTETNLDVVLLGEELNVERAGDLQLLRDAGRRALHTFHGLLVQLLGGQHQRRVARVHAGVLDVLADGES